MFILSSDCRSRKQMVETLKFACSPISPPLVTDDFVPNIVARHAYRCRGWSPSGQLTQRLPRANVRCHFPSGQGSVDFARAGRASTFSRPPSPAHASGRSPPHTSVAHSPACTCTAVACLHVNSWCLPARAQLHCFALCCYEGAWLLALAFSQQRNALSHLPLYVWL